MIRRIVALLDLQLGASGSATQVRSRIFTRLFWLPNTSGKTDFSLAARRANAGLPMSFAKSSSEVSQYLAFT
jgi:hypothetical protein